MEKGNGIRKHFTVFLVLSIHICIFKQIYHTHFSYHSILSFPILSFIIFFTYSTITVEIDFQLMKDEKNNAMRANYIEVKIDNMQQNTKCRMAGERYETVNHMI